MNLVPTSDQFSSLFKGAVVAAVGAALTYVMTNVGGITFGGLPTEAVVAVVSVAVNYLRKAFGIME